jgi:hypothetical protein
VLPVSFATPAAPETTGEEVRVEAFNRGDYSISTQDLVRIFDLTTPPPPRTDLVVEQFNGLARTKITRFNPDGTIHSVQDVRRGGPLAKAPSGKSAGAGSFRFEAPGCATGGCKSCNSARKSQ